MLFLDFAEICSRLEKTSGRLDTISILAQTLASLPEDDLPGFCRLILGKPFPEWSGTKLGVGPNLLYEAVAYVTGRKREEIIDRLSSVGDAGAAVEDLISQKSQTSFFSVDLTLADIMAALVEISGHGRRTVPEREDPGHSAIIIKCIPARGTLYNRHSS
jgi:DNA ligase-1